MECRDRATSNHVPVVKRLTLSLHARIWETAGPFLNPKAGLPSFLVLAEYMKYAVVIETCFPCSFLKFDFCSVKGWFKLSSRILQQVLKIIVIFRPGH
jgi:hypothetical protein